ncbi:uncharacterized protein N7484_007997 [Penicillium longicatenatum]|uniref:uncharacterized protein n=1 Tax=Penicillium longicatenatum TaxID=1561947 RepID=UPI002547484F|nr:uncharacterized protein N7484_007997 [Penicillium longicatenatum]KAJ5640135.1 hypothetical protein N7484_007997 [Penicillium longicatenatum]
MAYYGGDPYARPPSDRPPYDRPPYDRPPYEQPPYDRPPYDRGYGGPPPGARPPPGPPPPLPPGWHQEWEPNARRAFWVEDATGRPQWEPPFGPGGPGYEYGARGGPPPEPGYYPPQGPPPGAYEQRGPGGYDYPPQQQQEPERKSNTGKYIAAGLAGVAIGGLGGAFIEHEIDENNEEDEERRAYEDGREDQAFEDDGGW